MQRRTPEKLLVKLALPTYSKYRSKTGERETETTDNVEGKTETPTSKDQSESPRNFNFTTDIPKGKFRKVLLFWNQNEEY